MGRSLGVVVVGWASGFLIAIAWGATRANNPGLASTLSGWAIAGMVVTSLLLLSIAVSDRAERRRDPPAVARSRTVDGAATAARARERRGAARIAELEARLAREQEQLDAAVASLATTGHMTSGIVDPVSNPAAAELEPMLRREVVDTVAQLVGRAEPGQTTVLAEELEALLEKVR